MGSLCEFSGMAMRCISHCYAGMMPLWHSHGESVSFGTTTHSAGNFGWKLFSSIDSGWWRYASYRGLSFILALHGTYIFLFI